VPDETPDLAREAARAEARQELEEEMRLSDEALRERDRRLTALVLTFIVMACVLLPLVGLVVGITVRAFHWAAGL